MTPRDVAATLREISQLLQLKAESSFKVRAYDLGAEAFEALPPDPLAPGGLLQRVKAGTLSELSGVGKAIDQKVTELVTTGQLQYLNHLRAEFPPEALTLVRIPGVGPRKAAALIRELDVGTLADLEKACLEHRVRALKGFGEKTEAQILEGVRAVKTHERRWALGETRRFGETLLALVRAQPGIARAEIAGSVRRYAETNGDLDIVAALAEGAAAEPVMEAFRSAPGVESVIASGNTKCSVRMRDGLQADLRVVALGQFATALHHFTGGKNHHVKLRGIARDRGLTLSEYALARIDPAQGPALEVRDEAELYRHLGLSEIPPELREDRGEIEAASAGAMPELVAREHIQGFVHCHTTWSDGRNTLEEMVRAAKALGARFITISDHTQAAHYAGGLTPERLKQQWDEIAAVEERVGGIRVLRGSEVDILEDGRLDLPDAVLEQLDVVICSMHTRFKLDEDAQTERIRRALSHPLCRIWGHPTGRKVLDRPPASLRMEELFAVAAEKGVAVEANGTPDRLDLSADLLLLARKHGCKVSCSVDAHHVDELDRNLDYAVGTARRGWTERARVVNARGPDEFLAALKAKSGEMAG
jgi:DNA polymerase (family X)